MDFDVILQMEAEGNQRRHLHPFDVMQQELQVAYLNSDQ